MELADAIALLQPAHLPQDSPALWADLGCGTGLFTYALAHLLPPGSIIDAVDKSVAPLIPLPNPNRTLIRQHQLDFVAQPLPYAKLDGLLMANSLHYVKDQTACIAQLRQALNPKGCFLLVEYDTHLPNPWVPYPISYHVLPALFNPLGFGVVTKLQERPSRYGRANLYAALIGRLTKTGCPTPQP